MTVRVRQVQVVKSIADHKPGDPTFITRDIAYSVGQRDWIRDQRVLSARKFLYTWDNSADPLLPGGVKPADLSSKGCKLQELAKTHGGHKFTYSVWIVGKLANVLLDLLCSS